MELDLSEGTSSEEDNKSNQPAQASQTFNFNSLLQHPHGGNKMLYDLLQ
jgi:hypothetical protein